MTGSAVELWQEPVRGEPLAPEAFALDGLDRIRGWGRYWPMTPMVHQLGFRVTQVVSGSAVASLPVTPWLLHPDGVVDALFIGDTVCGLAADTVLKPGDVIVPLHGSSRPLRWVADDCRVLVGRAAVVRRTRDWVYVEGSVEDGDGRAVSSIAMHAAIRRVDFPVPEQPPERDPITAPTYATPDPYRRPVPPEKHEVIDRFHEEGCVATFRSIAQGEAPLPPFYSLLGILPVAAEEGRVETQLAASKWLQAVDPVAVSPQYLGVQGTTTGVAALWTIAPGGMWPSVLEAHGTMLDSVPADGRRVTAVATAERLGGDLIRARVEARDGERLVTVAEIIGQLRPHGPRRKRQKTRSLVTVLFTDVVDSTAHAERVGDDAWSDLLQRHRELVRGRLAEHGGREIKTTGDGFLTTFGSPSDAIACARSIRDDAQRLGIHVRAGAHTGEVEEMGGDIAGIAVHVAARIEASAGAGQIWISDTVRTLVAGSDLAVTDEGIHELRGIDTPIRLWSVPG